MSYLFSRSASDSARLQSVLVTDYTGFKGTTYFTTCFMILRLIFISFQFSLDVESLSFSLPMNMNPGVEG